jgi:hypothetical protein
LRSQSANGAKYHSIGKNILGEQSSRRAIAASNIHAIKKLVILLKPRIHAALRAAPEKTKRSG